MRGMIDLRLKRLKRKKGLQIPNLSGHCSLFFLLIIVDAISIESVSE